MNRSKIDSTRVEPRAELDRLLAFLGRASRFWRTALALVLIGELGCLAFLLLRQPLYRSQTVLLYTETVRSAETGEPSMAPKSVAARMQELLNSRRELSGVVEQFDLYPDVRKAYGTFDAVDELRKHIEFRAPGGDTFSIAFQGTSPEQARDVTARLAELVVTQDADLRKKQTVAARDFLAEEKKRAAERLKNAEQDLAGFMAAHPSFALDAMPLATGAAIRASVARPGTPTPSRPRVVALPAAKAEKETSVAPPAPAVPSPADERAAREAAEEAARAGAAVEAARQSVAEKRERYTDAHPDVRAARDALARAEGRLLSARAKLSIATPPPAPAAVPAPAGEDTKKAAPRYVTVPRTPAEKTGNAAETKTEDLVALETDWARLIRGVTEARQRHDQVEAALFKADMAESSASGGQGTQTTMIDPAYLPQRPIPPGPRTIALLFFAASVLAGIGAALGRAALDDRIYDREGADDLIDVLAEVPAMRRQRRAHV